MPRLTVVDGEGSTGAAYARIRSAIVEGRYEPGERLVEQRVADDLGLSRTPVREAFQKLEIEGLVLVERNRGATVRTHDDVEIRDVYELRARLESLVAERAAERADADGRAALLLAADAFGAAVPITAGVTPLERARRLSEANRAFHDLLVDLAGFRPLAQALHATVDTPLVFRAFRLYEAHEVERSNVFHHLIAEAVAAGEAQRAGRLMTEHVLQGRDSLLGDQRTVAAR